MNAGRRSNRSQAAPSPKEVNPPSFIKKVKSKKGQFLSAETHSVLVGKQHQEVAQEDIAPLCKLCPLSWQSRGWKYLGCGLGEGVTWLVRPEHFYLGFKAFIARGEMLSHQSGGISLGCSCCRTLQHQGTAVGKSWIWFPNPELALAHHDGPGLNMDSGPCWATFGTYCESSTPSRSQTGKL